MAKEKAEKEEEEGDKGPKVGAYAEAHVWTQSIQIYLGSQNLLR